ncbi:MAG: hypothetical protein KF832_09825 [Caldilineaceae bacterium]|nr:hypothetical protein [Caldilineaceae bacterium]
MIQFRPRLQRACQSFVALLIVLGLSLPPTPLWAAPTGQITSTDDTLQNCDNVNEDSLQQELNSITQEVVTAAAAQINIGRIVDSQWRELKLDTVIDAQVDRAVERVKGEADYWNKLLSSWSAETAAELTRSVTNYTFESEAFQDKIGELSHEVAAEISSEIALLSAQSVSAAFFCLQTFISGNYSGAMVRAFEEQVQLATENVNFGGDEDLDAGLLSVIGQHKTALGGIGVIIVAQVSRRIMVEIGETIAERVAGRIVGRILGRAGSTIIPIAGWVLGAGMIAYDLYSSRDGALPQIQETLKSEEVKRGIRDEITAAIEPELRRELPQVARDISNQLFNQWRDVKRNIRQVLELSSENADFRALLNAQATPADLAKLVNLVGVTLPALGRDGLLEAVNSGLFAQVFAQPEAAFQIVNNSGSLQDALDWANAAGNLLDQVVANELYKHQPAGALDQSLLTKLLAVNDKVAIQKLALLTPDTLRPLLAVSTSNLAALAAQVEPTDLEALASYLPTLSQNQVNQLVARIISDPTTVSHLQDPALREYLANPGTNLDQALPFLLSSKEGTAAFADAGQVLLGQVSWRLFLFKYGMGQSALVTAGAVVLALIALRVLLSLIGWLFSPLTRLFGR